MTSERHSRAQINLDDRVAQLPLAQESADVQDAVTELHVAEEELRVQNDALTDARRDADIERQRYVDLFEFAPESYVVTDMNGTTREANRATGDLFGVTNDRIIGKPLVVFVAFADRPAFRSLLAEVVKTGRVADRTITITPRDGNPRHVAATVAAQGNPPRDLRWLLRDVSERVRHEQELRAVNLDLDQRVAVRTAQLERASAAKDEFLGMVSHELRTPITTIAGNAQVLRRRGDELTAAARLSAVSDIEAGAVRLQRLIEDLMLLAKVESHARDLEPVLAGRIAQRIAAECERSFDRTVRVVFDPDLPLALGDATYLEQILRNLIGNAAKYGAADQPIDVSIERTDQHLVFRVGDRGSGIPADQIEEVFEPFYRVQRTAHMAVGQGLGLAVARRLVQAQEGTIWAAAREGGGAEFIFTLPIDKEWD